MALLPRRTSGWWMRGDNISRPDLGLVAAVLALSGFGLLMIFSATRAALERRELLPSASTERQLVFTVIGVVAMIVLSYLDYRDYRFLAPVLYMGCLAALGTAFSIRSCERRPAVDHLWARSTSSPLSSPSWCWSWR